MTPADALAEIRGYAAANRIVTESHARLRMRERGVSHADLRHALTAATGCRLQPNDRWRVDGPDCDGDELTAIVVIEDGVVVVTLF